MRVEEPIMRQFQQWVRQDPMVNRFFGLWARGHFRSLEEMLLHLCVSLAQDRHQLKELVYEMLREAEAIRKPAFTGHVMPESEGSHESDVTEARHSG